MGFKKMYTASAKIVSIDTVQKDLTSRPSYSTKAFVEFTDFNGQHAKGAFNICDSPMYTTIRVNSLVEIEYTDSKFFNRYSVSLLNPEAYKRTPTPEELAVCKRNNRLALKQGIMSIGLLFATAIVYNITKSFLVMIGFVIGIYYITMYGSKQKREDADKKLSWYDKE